MAEEINTNQYFVGEIENTRQRDPPKKIGVIKGSQVNSFKRRGFSRHIGVNDNSWFVYEQVEYLRQYADRSGTGVLHVVSLIEEYSSKSAAINAAKAKV